MNYQQTIAALLIGLVVAFTSGYLVGRGEHEPSQVPRNLDVAGALAENVMLRDDVKNCRATMANELAEIKTTCRLNQNAH